VELDLAATMEEQVESASTPNPIFVLPTISMERTTFALKTQELAMEHALILQITNVPPQKFTIYHVKQPNCIFEVFFLRQ